MFGRMKLGKYGKNSRCKACVNAFTAAYREVPGVLERYKALNKARYLREKKLIMAQQLARHHATKDRPEKKMAARVRSGINKAMAGIRKSCPTFELLGYTRDELAAHIERQFTDGMGWHNMGEWHIDHIVSVKHHLDTYGQTDDAILRAWAMPNLRPLWARENISKHAKRTHLI